MFLCLVNERNWQNSHRLATLLATFRSSFTAWWRSVENYSFIILFTETLNRNKKFWFIHNLITMRPTPIVVSKELSLWNKIKYLNLNIFRTRCCKPLIFQTQIIWSNKIHSLKYLRSATFGSKDIVIRKSEFVAKTQFLWPCCWIGNILNLHFAIFKMVQNNLRSWQQSFYPYYIIQIGHYKICHISFSTPKYVHCPRLNIMIAVT